MLIASLLALLAAALYYAALCWAQPFADCRKCDGIGHQLRTDRKGKTKLGKVCRRCRGKRQRIRLGRRMSNAWIRTRDAGAR